MIPTFPTFKPIELDDRAPLTVYLSAHPPLASEYTFTNLFAWSETAHYQLAAFQDGFLIRKEKDGVPVLLQPLVTENRRAAVEAGLAYLAEYSPTPCFERVGEDFLAGEAWTDWPCQIDEDRDQFDYIYQVEELIALPGEKYHDKKNLLNQFRHAYPQARYLPMTAEMTERSLWFQHQWCDERECEKHESLRQEDCATFRMLSNFAALQICGGAIEINGELAAITIAERLNADTLVIHIEKARARMIGLYQAINHDFLAQAGDGFRYVNREQDLGVPGLRKAKTSYNPARMIKKYRICPRHA